MRARSNHVCLGLRLERISIGHLFLLAEISSPFLLGGPVSVVDLSNAVFVCSQDWRKADRDSSRWWFPLFLKLWAARCRRMDFELEQRKFSDYYGEETEFPAVKGREHGAKEFGSPWWWRLLAILMSDFHLSEETALDMPVAKAAMLFTAKAESEGNLKLWTAADSAFDSFCRDMEIQVVEFPPRSN
jgi:hypothetical protein